MAPGGDCPDRKAEETGLGQTAAEEWVAPTTLAHLCEDLERNEGCELLKWKCVLFFLNSTTA